MGIVRQNAARVRKFLGTEAAQKGWQSIGVGGAFGGTRTLDRRSQLGEYHDIVRDCVLIRAQSFARYTPLIYATDPDLGQAEPIEHDFTRLLQNPNPNGGKFKLLKEFFGFKLLAGEAFWFVAYGMNNSTVPMQLWPIRPDLVDVVVDEATGEIKGYLVNTLSGKRIALEPHEMLHDLEWNPFSKYRGYSAVAANILSIDTENETARFQMNFLKNNAASAGIVTLKNEYDKTAFEILKKQWNGEYAGAENAGKTIFLQDQEADFTKIGLSLGDLDMSALRGMSQQRLYNAFRTPKALHGETDSAGLGRGNIEAILYEFEALTVDVDFTEFDDFIRLAIKRLYNQDVWVRHKSFIPEDQAAKLAERVAGVRKWITPNQILREDGYDPVDGGDILTVPFNEMPISELASITATPEPPPATKTITTRRVVRRYVKKAGAQSKAALFAQNVRIKSGTEKRYLKLFKDQSRKTREAVMAEVKRQLAKSTTTKDVQDLLAVEWVNFVEDKGVNVALETLVQQLINGMQQAGETANLFLGAPSEDFVMKQSMLDSVFQSQERLLQSYDRETALKIQKQIAGGLDEGITKDEMASRIEQVFIDGDANDARRIAQTESHRAINEATTESYRQNGVTRIIWRANADACPICEELDGTEIGIDEVFFDVGDEIPTTERVNNYAAVAGDCNAHPNCACQPEAVVEG